MTYEFRQDRFVSSLTSNSVRIRYIRYIVDILLQCDFSVALPKADPLLTMWIKSLSQMSDPNSIESN